MNMNMKIETKQTGRARRAFTLIEMIGVLAIIAILAALLVPKIFESINSARINNTAVSYNTVKTAVMDHYAKYGSLNSTNGVTLLADQTNRFDLQLLLETFIDKPFVVKVGSASGVRVTSPATYDLSGSGVNDTANATVVVEAYISGVPYADAKDLNDRLDSEKPPFTFPATAVADTKGRVKWDPAVSNGLVTIYISHR